MIRLILLILAVAAGLAVQTARAGNDRTLWVEATGIAAIRSTADSDSARRRALADALLTAALAGGAELKGYTAMDRGVITADLSILRPRGRILRHQLLDAHREGAYWKVRVRAQVGEATPLNCGGNRQLVVTAYAPAIQVSPAAPAWSAAFASTLAVRLVDLLDRHPATHLDRVTDRSRPTEEMPVNAAFDYTSLTRGPIVQRGGDTAFETVIEIRASGQTVTMHTELRFTEGTGRVVRREIGTETVVPQLHSLSQLNGRPRARAEADLAGTIEKTFTGMLDALACQPPEARLSVAGDLVTAPIGSRHGLRRGALAVIVDPSQNFGFLEVLAIDRESVALEPLDPTRRPSQLNGLRVEFLEAGL
ncbi:hypothetical protein DKT77_10330 [Meridianimarinicoccus roseus]|uniref:Flagellar assembly protein T N-terminal domain-containing protein n=1 Tax=Meridianimarinicoccus roseus TaxID=2072018 RepID=A0A2V2LFB3_9RHOB|nr:flagellar assembly protein T N-terminal domain-containing protein [Meridianimarinicoccus roseus]PWR02581.1 hypothetical protein DKT77_10330 [Meridianimarinicoccus roseus]